MHLKVSLEVIMKLFIVSKKTSARVSSETKFKRDFQPLTFGQLIKKTLYEIYEKESFIMKIMKRNHLNILCFRKQPKRINWIWRENVTEGKKTKDISGEEV